MIKENNLVDEIKQIKAKMYFVRITVVNVEIEENNFLLKNINEKIVKNLKFDGEIIHLHPQMLGYLLQKAKGCLVEQDS